MQVIQRLAPSFNFPRTTIADGSASVRPASLRGLGPDQVLVLVNGKRRHTTALVHVNGTMGRGSTGADLNAIPVSAIEKIEILRDGAAAQYGSDAIAGVINIVLKSGTGPARLALQGGTTATDQGVGGDTTWDGGQFDGALGKGFELGRGWAFVTGEYRNRNKTNRAGPDPRDQIRAGDAASNPVPQPNHWVGDPETEDYLTFLNAQVPAGESTFLYAFGGWSYRDAVAPGFYRRALQFTQTWAADLPDRLPPADPDLGDGRVGDGRAPRDEERVVLGRSPSSTAATAWTSTSRTRSTPRSAPPFPRTRPSSTRARSSRDQLLANLDFSREIEVGLAGPLNVAFGTEFRREGYELRPGEPDSYRDGGIPASNGARAVPGAQVFPGFRPSNAADISRNNVALYADLEGDVASRLRLGLAGRFEHYSDFGSNLDGKLTVRLQAHERFVLRGAASTGFRAPSLAQSNFSAVSTNFINIPGQGTVPVEVGTFAVTSPVAQALGATDLKPEDSVHLTAGFAFTPHKSFDFTADYFNIKIDDRIVFSGNFTGGAISAILAPFGATGARFFTNAINTRTQGRRPHRQLPDEPGRRQHAAHLRRIQLQPDPHRGRGGDAAAARRPRQRALRPRGAGPHRVRAAGQPGPLHRRLVEEPLRRQRERRPLRQLLREAARHHGRPRPDLQLAVADRPRSGLPARQGHARRWESRTSSTRTRSRCSLPLQPQGVRYSTTNAFGINGRFLYARASLRF